MDKERILNFTIVLDGLDKSDLADEFIDHLEECSSLNSLNPKTASNQIALKNKVRKMGIDSLYKECNKVTAGWLDRFRKKWDRGAPKKEMPNISWESILDSVNKSMDSDLMQMNKMTRSMGEEWETLRANHQYLREKAGDISQKYNSSKNSILNNFPEHGKMLQDKYFKHLDDKFSLLNEVMINEQPSSSLLNDANRFSTEVSQILRRNDNRNLGLDTSDTPSGIEQMKNNNTVNNSNSPSVTDEDTSNSLPQGDREILEEAWDNYWKLDNPGHQNQYLQFIMNEDPVIGQQLKAWVQQYGR